MMTKAVQRKVLLWLADNSPGVSCMSVAFWLAFTIAIEGKRHPRCPDDFFECIELFDALPELRPFLPRMKHLSPTWARIVKEWDGIEAEFLREIGMNWSKAGQKTNALLQRAIEGAPV